MIDYDLVKEIAETDDENEVNDYLKTGWKLLGIASMNTDSQERSSPKIKYSLGWIDDFPIKHPKY